MPPTLPPSRHLGESTSSSMPPKPSPLSSCVTGGRTNAVPSALSCSCFWHSLSEWEKESPASSPKSPEPAASSSPSPSSCSRPSLGAVPREAEADAWLSWRRRRRGSGSDAPRGPTGGCEKRQTTGASQQQQQNGAAAAPSSRARHGTAPTAAKKTKTKNQTASAPPRCRRSATKRAMMEKRRGRAVSHARRQAC